MGDLSKVTQISAARLLSQTDRARARAGAEGWSDTKKPGKVVPFGRKTNATGPKPE